MRNLIWLSCVLVSSNLHMGSSAVRHQVRSLAAKMQNKTAIWRTGNSTAFYLLPHTTSLSSSLLRRGAHLGRIITMGRPNLSAAG